MKIQPPAFPPPPTASVFLPDELITEILSRLNVKSLMTLKCVCKSWNTLISDPIFVKKHLNLSKRNKNLALLLVGYPHLCSNSVVTISVNRLLSNSGYYEFPINCCGIIGSCNGLICLRGYYYYYSKNGCKIPFYLWNPATRTKSETSLSLPWNRNWDPKTVRKIIRFGFGYDNLTDKYKVLMLGFIIIINGRRLGNQVITTVKVFTLGDNIWRDIPSFPVGVVLCSKIDEVKYDGVYVSNSISWLFQKNLTTEKSVIVSLDLGTEAFTKLLLPQCCDELPLDNSTLCVLMDCICFSHDFLGTDLVIWQMKEFGVEDSWTRLFKISYQNLKINYELSDCDFQLIPLCLSENGATLILASTNATRKGNQAIIYNWRDNRVEKTEKANGIWWCTAKNYVESLISAC